MTAFSWPAARVNQLPKMAHEALASHFIECNGRNCGQGVSARVVQNEKQKYSVRQFTLKQNYSRVDWVPASEATSVATSTA